MRFLHGKLRKALAVTVAAGMAAFGLATLAPATPAFAAAGCTAAYSVPSDWGSGFTANLVVTNTGTTAITGWTVTYSYTGNQVLQSGWSGNWTQSGKTVTVTNASWNGSLAVGANSGVVGANFNNSGPNVAPTSVTCTPAGGSTTPSINASPGSLSIQQGSTGTFTLALSAAPTSNETVTIASTGNTGLTASPTTLTFTPSNFATAQTVTVTANTSSTGTTTFTASGTGYTSATITATETARATATINASPTSLSVVQGSTGTFTLALSAAPTSNETVSIASTGNTGLTASPTTLTFTPSNFATAQTVTVTANASGTGATTFTASGTGYTSATVTATETAKVTPTINASPTSLSVTQGSTGKFTLALSAAPTSNETVSVTASGNTGLTASPTTLTFTPSNFSTAQTVTVTANATGTGTTTFTASGTGYTSATVTATETTVTSSTAPQLQVSGNKLVNTATGATVVLHGVNRSGTEYSCVQGNGLFDGPNDQASITAIKSWGPVNAVRVPLNEACWNAESYVNSSFAGTNYINAIKAYVSLLNSNGIVAILDLHWTDGTYTGPGAGSCTSANQAEAFCQKPMPDAAQAVPFWTSVANTFKGNDAVIFDLFNEPFPEQADSTNETEGWQCWLNGGSSCVNLSFTAAGMQTLVNAVRSTGANNVLMLGGLEWSNDLTQWVQHEPTDPDHDLAASWHSYNFNACSNQSCWTSQVAPVAAQVPVITGEFGENDCAGGYVTPLSQFMESQGISFVAWAWNADFACTSGPGLITDYTGTPTGYGAAVKAIMQALPAS